MDIVASTVGTLVLVIVVTGVVWQYVIGNPQGFRNAVLIAGGIFVFVRIAQTQHDTHFIQKTVAYASEMASAPRLHQHAVAATERTPTRSSSRSRHDRNRYADTSVKARAETNDAINRSNNGGTQW